MTLTTVNAGMLDTQAQYNGFKNRIINGAMVIDQRNAGASVSIGGGNNAAYTLDRWQAAGRATLGVFSVQQVTDAPTGFANSLKLTVTTADATVTDSYNIQQKIEGFNVADLSFGSASASTVTLSFMVKSSLTGAFGGSLTNSNFDRVYPFSYTISAANTWEQKSVTIAGDTSGTWLTTNGIGFQLNLSLGASAGRSATANVWTTTAARQPTGSVNLIATNGATLQFAGVQLEKGSTATSFDYRPYGTELALCQRYYFKLDLSGTVFQSSMLRPDGSRLFIIPFKQTMRAAPTSMITYDADGSGATLGTPSLTTDLVRVNTTPSLTAGSDPRFTAFNVSAEL